MEHHQNYSANRYYLTEIELFLRLTEAFLA